MIIEWLKLKIDPKWQQEFLQKDQEIWTTFLSSQPGFIKKEVWINPEDAEEVIFAIYWQTREQWKSIPSDQLEKIEEKFKREMGDKTSQLIEAKEYLEQQL